MDKSLQGLLGQLGAEQPKIESLDDLKTQPKQFFSTAGVVLVEKIMTELAAGLKGKDLNPTDFDHVMGISARADEIGKLMLEGSKQISDASQAFTSNVAGNGVDSMVTESEDAVELHLNLDPNDMLLMLSLDATKAKIAVAMAPYSEEEKRIFSIDAITGFCMNPSVPYDQKIKLLDCEIDGVRILLGASPTAMDHLKEIAEDGGTITRELISKHLQDGIEIPQDLVDFQDKIASAAGALAKVQDSFLEKFSKLISSKNQVVAASK